MTISIWALLLIVVAFLFILYLVIYHAVKDAINKSVIGQMLEERNKLDLQRNSKNKSV